MSLNRRQEFRAALLRARAGPAGNSPLARLAALRAAIHDLDAIESPEGEGALELPAGSHLERDLAYGPDSAQKLDLYSPAAAHAAPLVLFVHGGGWRNGDKAMPQMVRHKVPHWLAHGCIVASMNYRLLPEVDVLAQADDVARALAFVQRAAPDWGGDTDRVLLVGHSAGAHLAALISADFGFAERRDARCWRGTVAIDSAALDMPAIMARPHFRFYDPVFGADPAFWRAASPLHRLQGPPAVPMLLVVSSLRDDSEPPARAFAAKACELGGQAEVLLVPLTHLESNDQLGLPSEYTDAVDAFSRRVGCLD